MDLTDTIAPNSDQLDAVDLLAGPRTFTIKRVSPGNADQPVNIDLVEFPRTWRPGKSMRRVLVACWGPDAATYVGRRITLFCDPSVRFGGQEIGGTRISHLSHLEKRKQVPLLVSRGKSAMFVVHPLADADTFPWDAEISTAAANDDVDRLLELHAMAKAQAANPAFLERIAAEGIKVRDRLALAQDLPDGPGLKAGA